MVDIADSVLAGEGPDREPAKGLEVAWTDAGGGVLHRAVWHPIPDDAEGALLPWCFRGAARAKVRFELRADGELLETWDGSAPLDPACDGEAAREEALRTLRALGWNVEAQARGLRLSTRSRRTPNPLWLIALPLAVCCAPLFFLLSWWSREKAPLRRALALALEPLRLAVSWESRSLAIELDDLQLRWRDRGEPGELPLRDVGAVSFAPTWERHDSTRLRVIAVDGVTTVPHAAHFHRREAAAARRAGAALRTLLVGASVRAHRRAG
ncbi:hypothetical protein [Sorangium sp. So ce1097]|uniref:hypothetical protein n=1 Tax=Sorangium sp. So ce1097 TaxID=3133330 RepID=UPI003F6093A8